MDHEASPTAARARTGPPYTGLAIAAVAVTPLIAVVLRVQTAQALWAVTGGSVRGVVIAVGVLGAVVVPLVYLAHRLVERSGPAWWLLGVVPGLITSALVVLLPEREHVEDIARDMHIGSSAGLQGALLPTTLSVLALLFVSAAYVLGVLRDTRDTPRGGWRTLGVLHVLVWVVLVAVLAFVAA